MAREKAKAAELPAKAEQAKQLVVTGMAETLARKWDKAKDRIRQDRETR